MHEMSIAVAIQEQVLSIAQQNNLKRVTHVRLRMGELRLIVPEALEAAWQAASEGTAAEGAALEMIEVAARGRCRKCGHEYRPEWPIYLCPQCDQASIDLLAGEELLLEEIAGDRDE